MRGTIRFLNPGNQWGRIDPEGGGATVFFHYDSLQDRAVAAQLGLNAQIEYELVDPQPARGPAARNVQLLGPGDSTVAASVPAAGAHHPPAGAPIARPAAPIRLAGTSSLRILWDNFSEPELFHDETGGQDYLLIAVLVNVTRGNTPRNLVPVHGARPALKVNDVGMPLPEGLGTDAEGNVTLTFNVPADAKYAELLLTVTEGGRDTVCTKRWTRKAPQVIVARHVRIKSLGKAGDISMFDLFTTIDGKPDSKGLSGTVVMVSTAKIVNHEPDGTTKTDYSIPLTTVEDGHAFVQVEPADKKERCEVFFYVQGTNDMQGPHLINEVKTQSLPCLHVTEVPAESGKDFIIVLAEGDRDDSPAAQGQIEVWSIGDSCLAIKQDGAKDAKRGKRETFDCSGRSVLHVTIAKPTPGLTEEKVMVGIAGTRREKGPFTITIPKKAEKVLLPPEVVEITADNGRIFQITTKEREGTVERMTAVRLEARTVGGSTMSGREINSPDWKSSQPLVYYSTGRITVHLRIDKPGTGMESGDHVIFAIADTLLESAPKALPAPPKPKIPHLEVVASDGSDAKLVHIISRTGPEPTASTCPWTIIFRSKTGAEFRVSADGQEKSGSEVEMECPQRMMASVQWLVSISGDDIFVRAKGDNRESGPYYVSGNFKV